MSSLIFVDRKNPEIKARLIKVGIIYVYFILIEVEDSRVDFTDIKYFNRRFKFLKVE